MPVLLICTTFIATALTAAGGLLVYLSAEKQLLRNHPLSPAAGLGGGTVLLLFAWGLFTQYFGVATGLFVLCTWLMCVLSAMPVAVALVKRRAS